MCRRIIVVTIAALALWTTVQAAGPVALPSFAGAESDRQPKTGVWSVFAQSIDQGDAGEIFDAGVVTDTTGITTTLGISATGTSSDTAVLASQSQLVQPSDGVTQTAESGLSFSATVSDSLTVTTPGATPIAALTDEQDELSPQGAVDGTILANRTNATARFFVEGQTYTLPSLRSIGLDLPRTSTVLNLYNCDAEISEEEASCFWDPYMIDREGFYEIVAGADVGRAVNLLLQEVGGPDGADVWIQNRSAEAEVVVYRNQVYDLLPGAIREFSVGEDALPTFFLRSCVEVDGAAVCEWAPVVADPGVYYVLREVETVGGLPNSRVTMLELEPVSGAAEEREEMPLAGKQIVCDLLVPALNVRSGPGLEYEIVAKIRGTETAPASVLIIGRDVTGEWVAVDERVAPGGWITGSASYVSCESATSELDEVEVTDGRLAPTPTPVPLPQAAEALPVEAEAEAPVEGDVPVAEQAAAEATAEPTVEIPDGQSLLVINNGFDHDIRFTLDQTYRVQPGPSEYDLQPGDAVSVLVYPGMIGFSASTPWRGISGNDDFFIEQNESRVMWLYFVSDPDGSGEWILQY